MNHFPPQSFLQLPEKVSTRTFRLSVEILARFGNAYPRRHLTHLSWPIFSKATQVPRVPQYFSTKQVLTLGTEISHSPARRSFIIFLAPNQDRSCRVYLCWAEHAAYPCQVGEPTPLFAFPSLPSAGLPGLPSHSSRQWTVCDGILHKKALGRNVSRCRQATQRPVSRLHLHVPASPTLLLSLSQWPAAHFVRSMCSTGWEGKWIEPDRRDGGGMSVAALPVCTVSFFFLQGYHHLVRWRCTVPGKAFTAGPKKREREGKNPFALFNLGFVVFFFIPVV